MTQMSKRLLGFTVAAVLACTALAGAGCMGAAEDTASAAKAKKAEFDPSGKYRARMGIQTCNTLWVCQFNYYNGDQNSTFGTDKENKLFCADASGGNKVMAGEFSEAELAGNGTYTVTLTGADFGKETTMSQLHVATDIPLNDQIKFSDVKVVINGKEFAVFDEGVMEDEDPYLTAGMVLLCANHWRQELSDLLETKGQYKQDSGYVVLKGDGNDEIQITFTVSGFNYDNPDAVEAAEEPQDADTAEKPAVSGDKGKKADSSQSVPFVPVVIAVVVLAGAVIVFVIRKKK